MINLSTDMDNLRKAYRAIFLQTTTEVTNKIESMTPRQLKTFLDSESKKVYKEWENIQKQKDKITCKKCASCCKLACSEFSPQILEEKVKNGDYLATEFTKVFIPYENTEEARSVYPEYFELLNQKAKDEAVYFYKCKNVTAENTCPDYENRPVVCREFPDNPIAFLPIKCAYNEWKAQTERKALELHSKTEILCLFKETLVKN